MLLRMTAACGDLEELIGRLELFEGVSLDTLRAKVLVGEEVRLRRGEVLVHQGERSLGFDILLEGMVEFVSEAGGRRVHVITFEPPGFWGHEPLMADVRCPYRAWRSPSRGSTG